jgi:phage N-6-adenine-methyltransferase
MAKPKETNLVQLSPANRANAARLGYIGRAPTHRPRDADSWFTPDTYLDSVRAVFGGKIDLDPFSSKKANEIVKAKRFFSIEKSAFDHDWSDKKHKGQGQTVFMNPPYSAGLCARAVNRFVDQFLTKHFEEGVVLVNNATDTRWFNQLVKNCTAICFTDHRISFWNADHKNVSGNTRGQAFFYFGENPDTFTNVFSSHGFVVKPVKSDARRK